MIQSMTIKGAELKRAADQNDELMILAYYAANRERNRVSTDIRQMRKNLLTQGESIDAVKWIDAWRSLESLGMGSLIIGRNGKATRFKWNYSLKAIGRAAIDGIDVRVQAINSTMKGAKHIHDYHDTYLPELQKERIREAIAPIVKPAESIKNVVTVALRSDYSFECDLPKLTKQEADTICAAIRRCV